MIKQNNIYILNYKIKWHLITLSPKGSKQMFIENKNINSFFKEILQNIKNNYITIFVPDLKQLLSNIIEIKPYLEDYDFKDYKYNNSIYMVQITHMFIRNKSLILKDYYHFIRHGHKDDSFILKSNNLYEMYCELLLQFKIDINLRKFLSLTSVSNKIFSIISKDKKVSIKKLNATEDSFIRRGYYGGRNEIYEPIGNDLYYYDVNSLYAFVMKMYKMPIGVPVYRTSSFFMDNDIHSFYGYLEVLIKTPHNALPILPFRPGNKYEKMGVIYPEGTLVGVYFSEELKYALQNGYEIIHIYKGYEFVSGMIFDAFIDKTYELRQKAKSPFMKKIYKNIMNNLYGYYGATFIQEITSNDGTIIGIKRKYNSVAISGAITAYARIYMYSISAKYLGNLVYWDTDGIFVKVPLDDKYLGSALGKFRLIDVVHDVVFLAPKTYLYRYNNTCYQYTLKGITINKYILEGGKIMDLTKRVLLNDLKEGSLSYTYTLSLKEKMTGEIKVLTFTIINKRAITRRGSSLATRPWIIVQKDSNFQKS